MDALIALNRRMLDERLTLPDDDFERWMASLQLLFLVRVFSCGEGEGVMSLCTKIKEGRVKGQVQKEVVLEETFHIFWKIELELKEYLLLVLIVGQTPKAHIWRSSSWNGTGRALLQSYMDEFVWKTVYGDSALYHLWSQIREYHPPPRSTVWEWGLFIGSWSISNRSSNFWKALHSRSANWVAPHQPVHPQIAVKGQTRS